MLTNYRGHPVEMMGLQGKVRHDGHFSWVINRPRMFAINLCKKLHALRRRSSNEIEQQQWEELVQ